MMPVKRWRNIGIVAHVDAGKTTITENMLYLCGEIRNLGSVDKGTSHTDWLEVERERGISVRAASTSLSWKDHPINLIDTPGHVDFAAEVERSLRVLDGAILVVSAVEGVQAQTEILWKALHSMHIPTLIFINKIDRIGSDVGKVLGEIHRLLSPDAVPLQQIVEEGTGNVEITGERSLEGKALDTLIEALAERDDEILHRYLDGEKIPWEDIKEKLQSLIGQCRLLPVLYGSAIKGLGMEKLLDAVIRYLPEASGNEEDAVAGVVFRIEHNSSMGRIAHVRLYHGTIKNRDVVMNFTQKKEEKITQIRKIHAQKHQDIGILRAGDIAGVCGFEHVRIGDILGSPEGIPVEYHLAVPLLKVQAFAKNDGEYPKMVSALQELADEDPLLDLQWLQNERELHVKIMGLIQLEILSSMLKRRFGLDIEFGKPSVIYKETPTRVGEGFVAYTMPKPCWAVLRFLIEPGPRGSGLSYSSQVRAEDILMRYQNQVEKTMPEALQQGLHGWEVTDLKVTLVEGEHHVFHTHPLDFIVATPMAIMDGLVNTGSTLLEPILEVRITAPEELGGRILGDIVQMRGSFDSPVIAKGSFTVEGTLPVATSLDYPVRLGSLTAGRGTMTTRFLGYRECPLELGATAPRRGINPLDRSKYILSVRKAL